MPNLASAMDAAVLGQVKPFTDVLRAGQNNQLVNQQAQIDNATKANVYKTQLLSAAAGSGDQNLWNQTVGHLAQNGIDVSDVPADINTGAAWAQSGRLAQSPLGSLLNAGLKNQSNQIALSGLTGEITPGAISPVLPGMNSMLPNLIQAESGGNPNAISPAGAQGIAQIMPSTAAQPGYGVTPLQGMENGNPSTAPVGEQLRFSNDYLNAMQAKNGGNQQLAAASYNAGPGRVEAALKQLPAETQNYVQKVAPFAPPRQNPNETINAYNQRVQREFEAYKADPNYIAQTEKVKKIGADSADAEKANIASSETFSRLNQNLDSLKEINKNLPEYGGIVPVGIKARGQLIAGSPKGFDASQKWDEINQQQVVNAISDLVKGGQIRGNQFIERIINRGYAIDPNAPAKTRADEIEILRNELQNAAIQAQNTNASYNNGEKKAYVPTLPPVIDKNAAMNELRKRGKI